MNVLHTVKKTNGTTDGSEVFFKELSREDGLSHRTNKIDQSPAYSARNQWIWDPNEWRKQPDGRLSKNTYRRQRLQDQKMLEEFK